MLIDNLSLQNKICLDNGYIEVYQLKQINKTTEEGGKNKRKFI